MSEKNNEIKVDETLLFKHLKIYIDNVYKEDVCYILRDLVRAQVKAAWSPDMVAQFMQDNIEGEIVNQLQSEFRVRYGLTTSLRDIVREEFGTRTDLLKLLTGDNLKRFIVETVQNLLVNEGGLEKAVKASLDSSIKKHVNKALKKIFKD